MSAALLVQAMKVNRAIARMTQVKDGIRVAYAEVDRLETICASAPPPLSTGYRPHMNKPLPGGEAPATGRPPPMIFTEAVACAA